MDIIPLVNISSDVEHLLIVLLSVSSIKIAVRLLFLPISIHFAIMGSLYISYSMSIGFVPLHSSFLILNTYITLTYTRNYYC